ncbi:hypothetical protein A3F02_02290 [Candidatus Curtissbacteria bacterium RIFCSPHIGHO2_12_FULL_38_9b]|uniref:Carbohydrate kinase PfkB domain-containing protein n=2 Tax=Candidatus Curtissiibacteriota TaxID=1752717 RepID=A0A1F5GXY3_9BACT|nr:MAG: hypothetical protein A3A48_01825 [Candidatus Curtissbacteria bacterium RIFCSPLOWO2_01_FULL_37_9]OGD96731.1 MAG: hypothetical protein A3F02_02290 [Candidatus Curtissbacteria bacterium RIFCSPHIGHO2_12_FULL_38_9b]
MDKNVIFDIITIGDSTIDTFIKIHDATVECDLNQEECKICVRYGDKIPVDAIGSGVAGNAANVAVGCTKLGLNTAIYTNLGSDNTASTIKKTLEENGVKSDYIVINKNKESNLSVVITFQGERTAFVYHQPWDYHLPNLKPCSWLYLTSVAENFTNSNLMDEIYHYVEKIKCKFAYNPGTFQLKANVQRYPRLLEKCEVFIVNYEEAKKILNISLHEKVEPKDLLSKLLLLGPKTVVITDGAHGSYASDGNTNLKAGIVHVEVMEKTGAGDAYTSGLLSALCLGRPLAEAMIWGTVNSASAIQLLGPQNGLLNNDQANTQSSKLIETLVSTF